MTEETPRFTCLKCGGWCDESDNFCRRCGRALKPGNGFLNSHTGIILLALVLGPFALPAVWTSKRISRTAKWVYSLLLLLMGYYLVVACWQVYKISLESAKLLMGGGF